MQPRARLLVVTALATITVASACGGAPGVATAPGAASGPPGATLLPVPIQPSATADPAAPASLPPIPTPPALPTDGPVLPTEGPVLPTDGPPPIVPTAPPAGIGVIPLWSAPAPTPEPTGYAPLVGRWTHQDEFITEVIIFLPDGRYGDTTTVGDAVVPESGTYSADGSTLTFSPLGDEPQTFSMEIVGDVLSLSNSEVAADYTLEPGSPDAVIAEQEAVDQQEAALDEQWRARLPVAPLAQQPPHIAVGEVPDDPNVGRIFVSPTVFVAPNLYTRITLSEITYTDGTTAQVQNTTNWHFLPTGRLYTIYTTWPTGRFYDRANPQPDVASYWSAYTIEPGGATERVAIHTDADEQLDLFLTHGRRNLIWGTELFGQVDWENEQLHDRGGG